MTIEFEQLNLTPPDWKNDPEALGRYLHENFSFLAEQLNALQVENAALYVAIADWPADVTQAEAEAGSGTTRKFWTPERVKQAIYALGYYKGNILGTVSQSGGIPTGAVIERGTNANGDYIRFADGTQICQGTVTVPNVSTAVGSIFSSSTTPTWTYPSAFSAEPEVHGCDTASIVIWVACAPSLASALIRALAYTSITSSRTLRLTAIGRWF